MTTLVMKRSDLERPAFSRASSSTLPARPVKGSPLRSSSRPGASPISMISALEGPLPGTEWFRVKERGQSLQELIFS